MADPSFSDCLTVIANVAQVLDHLEVEASTASTGTIATVETLRNSLEGDYMSAARLPIQEVLGSMARPLSRAQARAIIDPLLRQTALAIEYPNPNGSIDDIWLAIHDYMVANSQSINDTEDTFDTTWSAGGSNVGNAEVVRVTVDENGSPLGGFRPDTWSLTCVEDARGLGAAFQELWELEGTAGRSDNLDTSGGTNLLTRGIRTLSAANTTVVKNPTFADYTLDGSSQLTALPGFTQNTGANLYTNLSINTTYFLKAPNDSVNSSLQFNGDETIYQDMVTTANARFVNRPYEISVGVAKVGTPTGTIGVRVSGSIGSGGVSATLAHGAMTGSGTFDRLRIAVGQNSWPAVWNANDLKFQISLASSGSIDASNYFVVDDVIFAPLTHFYRGGSTLTGRGRMGQYIGVVRGTTASVKDDTYTATDSAGGTRGTIHWALSKIAQYGYLPQVTGGTETVSDV